jgi:hypothetical protein
MPKPLGDKAHYKQLFVVALDKAIQPLTSYMAKYRPESPQLRKQHKELIRLIADMEKVKKIK